MLCELRKIVGGDIFVVSEEVWAVDPLHGFGPNTIPTGKRLSRYPQPSKLGLKLVGIGEPPTARVIAPQTLKYFIS